MTSAKLPEALAGALGRVVADLRREWKREVDVMAAESRATIAELRAENAALVAAMRERADEQVGRVDKAIAGIRNGEDAKPLDPAEVRQAVVEEVAKIPRPKDGDPGTSVEAAEVQRMVDVAVAAAVPKPREELSGAAVVEVREMIAAALEGKLVEPAEVKRLVAEAVEALPKPRDGDPGESVDPADVQKMIAAEVAKLPAPKDGEPADPQEIERMVKAAVAAIPAPQPGRDGRSLVRPLIDRDGNLVVTFSDGSTESLGRVVGKDGVDAAGKPGLDGFGFDDMDVAYDGDRGVTLKFVKGERVKEFALTLPIVLDRGIYEAGHIYQRGDGVTFGGSFWIAQAETQEKPGTGKEFRLAVKKGRDGKEAVPFTPPTGPVKI